MDVAGSRRHVHQQEVQRSPLRLQNNLFEGAAGHGTAPDKRLSGLGKIADGHPLHVVFLNGNKELVTLFSHHFRRVAFGACHEGDGGAVDIGIGQSHLVSQTCQSDGQVHCNSAFSHAAFAGSYADDVAHLPNLVQVQFIHGFFSRFFHDGFYFHLRSAGGVAVDSGLGGTHQIVLERVRPLGESQRYNYFTFSYFHAGNHTKGHNVLVFPAGMLHFPQPLQNQFLSHFME